MAYLENEATPFSLEERDARLTWCYADHYMHYDCMSMISASSYQYQGQRPIILHVNKKEPMRIFQVYYY